MNDKLLGKVEQTIPFERSIQAELLLLLRHKPSHGYELIQRLHEADFKSSEADTATVYRNLRRMDKDGLITSHWEISESGPGRRLYKLTPQGEEALKVWAKYMAQQIVRLENFLKAYSQFEESLTERENGVSLT